jgi:hypothetical protein
MTPSSQLDIRVVFSLQYRSYLRPIFGGITVA